MIGGAWSMQTFGKCRDTMQKQQEDQGNACVVNLIKVLPIFMDGPTMAASTVGWSACLELATVAPGDCKSQIFVIVSQLKTCMCTAEQEVYIAAT